MQVVRLVKVEFIAGAVVSHVTELSIHRRATGHGLAGGQAGDPTRQRHTAGTSCSAGAGAGASAAGVGGCYACVVVGAGALSRIVESSSIDSVSEQVTSMKGGVRSSIHRQM